MNPLIQSQVPYRLATRQRGRFSLAKGALDPEAAAGHRAQAGLPQPLAWSDDLRLRRPGDAAGGAVFLRKFSGGVSTAHLRRVHRHRTWPAYTTGIIKLSLPLWYGYAYGTPRKYPHDRHRPGPPIPAPHHRGPRQHLPSHRRRTGPRSRRGAGASPRTSPRRDRALLANRRRQENIADTLWRPGGYIEGRHFCWLPGGGNVQYGINELRRDDSAGESEMRAWAWDVQNNTRSVRSFIVPHARMAGRARRRSGRP